ncbi:MAG: small subunit ribosomal protein S16 [Parcubacteria group bacterium Gr01-1014_31]|nr:MAG: small subunit ribosomal protein S16 [Parcubacteria group bacterium Gr01-1014_31]
MLAIRFARVGKTKQPTYRITVSEKGRDLFGRSLEILGHYNPRSKVCDVNAERIKYWLSVGAAASPTVHNLLVDQHVIEGPKIKVTRGKKKAAETPAAAAPAAPAPAKAKPAAA